MEITTLTRIKLTAADGMILTNGEVFGKTVFLSIGDSPDNWYEITEEEAQAKMKEQEVRL